MSRKHEKPVPEPTPLEKFEAVKFAIENKMKHLNGVIEDFRVQLEKNPSWAFEWGSSAAEAAGRLKAFTTVHAALQKAPNLATTEEEAIEVHGRLREYCAGRALELARYPQQSTSPLNNISHLYETAGWAEIALLFSGQMF
jgi:metal-sulfur cluster biosynthetic enzyme